MKRHALEPHSSVTVTASAGTGKTWLLTSRILRLLLDGARPDSILALTFTRKAAAEMRARVAMRLEELALCDDATLAQRLAAIGAGPDAAPRARGLYEEWLHAPMPLKATTLHAFCQELIARFPLEAGVAPGYTVEEGEGGLLASAWDRLLRDLTAAPAAPATRALHTLIGLGETEWKLRELTLEFLARRSDWWAYAETAPDPVAFAAAELRGQLGVTEDADPATFLDSDPFDEKLRRLHRYLERVSPIGSIRLQPVAAALGSHGAQRYAALLDALLNANGQAYQMRFGKQARAVFGAAELEQVRTSIQDVTADFERLRPRRNRWLTLERTAAGLTIGVAALAALSEELRARNALTFAELEWLACRLLRDDDGRLWVRYKLDQKIEHLLVDEFQDTSPTQWSLLRPLLEDMAAREPGRARSAFIVGDPKQSIYGFRRANAELLGAADEWLRANLGGHQEQLSESRRSAPAVVEFVNALFQQPELEASFPAFPKHATAESGWGRVEIAPLVEDANAGRERERLEFRNPLEQARLTPEDRRAAAEGERIALRIRALVAAGVAVSGQRGSHALGYGDVMILLRSRTQAAALERALAVHDVPFLGSARGALLEAAEARDLLALLRALHSPHRELDLAHALRSPLFALDDGELMQLARLARREQLGAWLPALAALAQTAAASAAVRRAQRLLASWLLLVEALPVHDLLDRIVHEGAVAARYEAALPPALRLRVRGNLGALAQLALELDAGRYPGLGKFLRELERLAAIPKDAPDEPAPIISGSAVRVLTVHAAKGLEAPAVFVAQAASAASGPVQRWLVEWPPDQPRPTHFVLDGGSDTRDRLCEELVAAQQRRQQREELNLLYVAVTRARQFLHVSGFENRNQEQSWYRLCASAFVTLPAPRVAPAPGCDTPQQWGSGGIPLAARAAPAVAAPVDARLRAPLSAALLPSLRPSGAAVLDPATVRRGDALHALLQKLTEEPGATVAALRAWTVAKLAVEPSARELEEWLAEARALVAAPGLAGFFDARRFRRAWNEVPITYREPGPQGRDVRGIIDRCVDDGQVLWVVDYKTHQRPDAAALALRYREQLQLYAKGVTLAWPGRTVRAGLVLTATRQWVEMRE